MSTINDEATVDVVLGAVLDHTTVAADQGAFIRLAGAATREGQDFTSWVEARLCLCEDGEHALLPQGRADAVFYWTADVAQVEAYQQFWSGAPHIRTRRQLLITIGGES